MVESETGLGFKPAHPGAILREDILPALGMTVTDLATHLGVQRATLSALINERQSVSMAMALRLGKAFKNGARFWLALQMQHDLWDHERETKIEVQPLSWTDGEVA